MLRGKTVRLSVAIFIGASFLGSFRSAALGGRLDGAALHSLSSLEEMARGKIKITPHVALAEGLSAAEVPNADPLGGERVPNYIRALAQHTKAAPQFAHLVRTVLYGGSLSPETKMAIVLRVAQVYGSAYTAAHAQRWLRASESGRGLLAALKGGAEESLPSADSLALRYAELLTRDIHGVSDSDFQRVRAHYNDSQIVELTMTVCFANYFVRLNEALNLPVEAWAFEPTANVQPAGLRESPSARVALISDEEMEATRAALAASRSPQPGGLGLGIANSQRAMLRVPALAKAWREYGMSVRNGAAISRELQLHISFAVSMANGCRYCTLHQVLGLKRLGVDPKKLLAMRKDDSALTKSELAAVSFARKLTRMATVTDEDFALLKAEFGERGAVEVALQTCAFAFMNRFTDGLRLPSEDEAIRAYQEIYGAGAMARDWNW